MFKVRRNSRRGAAAGAFAAVLLLAGCGGGSDQGSRASGAPPQGEPVSGGTLRMIMVSDGQDLDPTHTTVAAGAFGDQILPIFDTLIRVDAKGTITPRIARAVTTADNGSTWTIKLREGVKFSDGTTYDAEALKFNWERDALPTSTQTADAKQIATMKVVDPTTLEVKLVAPNPHFPFLLQAALGMNGSPTAIKAMGDKFSLAPVGAGPFILETRVPQSQYSYRKNPNYWDKPRPYVDKLVIRLVPEMSQAAASFKAGEADVLHSSIGDSDWKRLIDGGADVLAPKVLGGTVFWFNNTKAPTDDVRVRRALVMAMDPNDANQKAASGAAEVVTTLFPADSPYYDPDAKIPWNGDVAEAQKLIDSYVAEKSGPVTIEWTVTKGSEAWPTAFAQQIMQKLKNVKINLVSTTPAHALEKTYDDSFQIVGGSFGAVDPAQELNGRLVCESGRNNANYCNPQMDAALEAAAQTSDLNARVAAYKTAQQILWTDVPIFFQNRSITYTATGKKVGGVNSFAAGLITLDSAWLAK